MPRRKSYTTAEGFQSLDQRLIAQQMIPLRVEEKQGDWDAETKTNAQKTNADGVPQWLIQTLFQPIDGDTEHAPEVVPVTVTAKVKPVIRVGVPVEFVGFGAWVYVSHDKTTKQVTSVGRSFMAAGFKQNGGE